jgi:hypothetical protein
MKDAQKLMQLALFGLVLVAFAACGGNEQQPKTPQPADSSAGKESLVTTGKIRQVVMAKGRLMTGKEAVEFEPFEESLFDEEGRELEHKSHWDGYGTLVQTTYDAQGHEMSKIRNAPDKTGKLEFRYAWSPDFSSLKVEEFSARESRVVAVTEKKFDANGKVLEEKEVDMHLPEFPIEHKIIFQYDAQGRLVSEKEIFEGKEFPGAQYTYDKKGRLAEVSRMDSEGKVSQRESFMYNDKDLKIERHLVDFSAFYKDKQLEAKYEYDEQGNMVRELHYSGLCNEDGRSQGKCQIQESIDMTYDQQGRLLSKHIRRQSPSDVDMELKYEYKAE